MFRAIFDLGLVPLLDRSAARPQGAPQPVVDD